MSAISVKTEFYVAAGASFAQDRSRVLKYGQMFAIFDPYGDIRPSGLGEHGIYYCGTRFLSHLSLSLCGLSPLFLSSGVKADNSVFSADLTNVDLLNGDKLRLLRGALHLVRSKVLWDGVCYEQLRITNYGTEPVRVPLQIAFAADFIDLFEVRGVQRSRRGERLPDIVHDDRVVLTYRGLDNITRRTQICCFPPPADISASAMVLEPSLNPRETTKFLLMISCDGCESRSPDTFDELLTVVQGANEQRRDPCTIRSSNDQFNHWLNRSLADVHMMIIGNPEREYPYAGVPWFSTVFGRDGIITALECLWLRPQVAKGVLEHLAAKQAQRHLPEAEADPGKILHEERCGEMANLGEIPFREYYGSVDATPLFVMLAGAYFQRTGDLQFIQRLWPHIQAALSWIDNYGDADGDGFVEYQRQSTKGLIQQGWKDSSDSVFHADGSLAEGPIALCEVQGYVYAAKKQAAMLARALGDCPETDRLDLEARELQRKFEDAFWCEELSLYALALDGRKRPCRVRSSNAGHCLFTGIASPARAHRVAKTLMEDDFFSGWGIRTISSTEAKYNPISYHNGSVWPHDNALFASGLAKHGLTREAARLLASIFEASTFCDLNRLPELICGLHKRPGEGPTLYPVACSPQAWSAAATFLLLEASLGLSVNAESHQVVLNRPSLPDCLPNLWISGLQVNDASVDLAFVRHNHRVHVEVLDRSGSLDVVVRQ